MDQGSRLMHPYLEELKEMKAGQWRWLVLTLLFGLLCGGLVAHYFLQYCPAFGVLTWGQ